MDWKKYFCPVCGVDFTDEDDVVVCPECGTPHHRSCWKDNGHCINENLHGTGDSPECTYKRADSEEKTQVEQVLEKEEKQEGNSPFGENFPKFGSFFGNEEEKQSADRPTTAYINGKPMVYYEIAVRKNQKYYLPRFMIMDKLNKGGSSWNLVAFFCPLAWTVYRKLYKISALILAVYMLITGATVYSVYLDKPLMEAYNECYEEDPEFIMDIAAYNNGNSGSSLTPKQQKFYELTKNFSIPSYIYYGTIIATYGIKILVGIFANKLYMNKITRSIDIGEKIGLQGDALKSYIYRKNGVLPLIVAIIVAYVELMLI